MDYNLLISLLFYVSLEFSSFPIRARFMHGKRIWLFISLFLTNRKIQLGNLSWHSMKKDLSIEIPGDCQIPFLRSTIARMHHARHKILHQWTVIRTWIETRKKLKSWKVHKSTKLCLNSSVARQFPGSYNCVVSFL